MNYFQIFTKKASKSEFLRNVATIFTGTAVSQIIPLITMPILTRIYLPSDYGVLAVFIAFTSLSAVIATLRYEAAILLPDSDDSAMALAILCGLCVLFIAILISVLVIIFHSSIIRTLNNPSLSVWVYLVPLSVVFTGWSGAINYWLNRNKQYRKLAVNRVTVSVIVAMASLAFGFAGFGYAGLILSVIIGQFVALSMLFMWARHDVCDGIRHIKRTDLTKLAISYRKFPLFSLPSDAINAISQQIPILMLSRFFGPNVVGHFSFSQRILGMPLSLISQSVSDVFKQRASADYNKYGNCKDIFSKISRMLSAISVVPLVIIFLFAPIIFRVIFGEAWEQAGQYTRYLAPLYIFKFIVSPLSYVFYIANRQDADLVGQIGLLFVSVCSMIFGIYMNNPDAAIITFSGGYILVYCFYYWGARNLSRGKSFVLFDRVG